MTDSVISRNGVPIRLTPVRWAYVVEQHEELAGMRKEVLNAIADLERVMQGDAGEFLAIKHVAPGKALVVVYREEDAGDGFVITAFLTRRLGRVYRRRQLWPHP